MKRLIPAGAALLLLLGVAPTAWACPECRAQVNSGVYGPGFTTILLVMLLPTVVLTLVGVCVYYAGDIKSRLKGRTGGWQTARTARR
jgi:hypothetical protein